MVLMPLVMIIVMPLLAPIIKMAIDLFEAILNPVRAQCTHTRTHARARTRTHAHTHTHKPHTHTSAGAHLAETRFLRAVHRDLSEVVSVDAHHIMI